MQFHIKFTLTLNLHIISISQFTSNLHVNTVNLYQTYTQKCKFILVEGSLEVKLPTIWRDEKQRREEAERRERLEEIRVEETE